MWVELSTKVGSLQVEHGLVEEGDNLEVGLRLEELHTLDGASGDDASATTGLGAPGDFLALSVGDRRVGLCGCPDTPVCGSSVR